ncbi:MAG: AAA family ATPase [Pseudohongiella sp.]|nr:AAA family ATPase [Pseudohongiella sp.]
MYLEYYSLERPPFRITPDPSLFFTGGANGRGVVLEALLYAIQTGEGILKVVGEVGSGKTMLCRMLEQRLPDSVEVVYLANPKLTPHDILYAVAFELKIDVTQDTPRLVLMQKLQSHLLEQHAANRSVLVIIEEAQSMPLETLEEIRLFSNLETHQHKLMQIILFGQPELDKNLQEKNIRQLKERITHSFYLNPLTPDEVSDYLRHRLQAAGCPAPQIFSKAAENLIAKASGGLTRRINILADKAMLAAYSESATATRPRSLGNQLEPTVHVQHVKAAIQDSDYTPTRRFSPWMLGFAAMLVIIGILVWQLIVARSAQSSPLSAIAPSSPVTATANQALLDTTPTAPIISSTQPEPEAEPAPEPEPVLESVSEPASEPVSELASEPVLVAAPAAAPAEPAPAPTPTPAPVVATETAIITPAPMVAAAELPPSEPVLNEVDVVEEEEPDPVPAIRTPDPVVVNASGAEPFDAGVVPNIVMSRINSYLRLREADDAGVYTVQVLSINTDETPYVERTLALLDRSGLLENTYVCLTQGLERPLWRIVFGAYPSVDDARADINRLPLALQSNQPFIQNVARLQCLTVRS